MAPRIVTISGSTRVGSLNTRLALSIGARATEAGVEVDHVDLARNPLPLYDGDLEELHGQPEPAEALHARVAAAHGVVFACPEYNGGPTAVLKNTIDWLTRVDMTVFQGRKIALVATSPGSKGAATGLGVMSTIFGHMRCDVHEVLSIPKGAEVFGDEVETHPELERLDAWVEGYLSALPSA